MNALTVNKRVACTPFETTQTKVEFRGGLPMIKQKHELTKLTVVYDAETPPDWIAGTQLVAGDVIYVRGETCKHSFAKEVFELEDGKPFILIPLDLIIAVV